MVMFNRQQITFYQLSVLTTVYLARLPRYYHSYVVRDCL